MRLTKLHDHQATKPQSLSQRSMCTHTHTHGYKTTMLQYHKHSANHDHTKWNSTILQHHMATRQQSLVHMHTWLVGKIKYTKVPYIYTNLMGEKDKTTSQTCTCITGHVQGKPSILIYVLTLCMCYPLLFIVSVFSMHSM